MAPEILRVKQNMIGTKAGDIYSFAIICSELITRRPAWNIGEIEHTQERTFWRSFLVDRYAVSEVMYMIRRGGTPPYRPSLNTDDTVMVNPALVRGIVRASVGCDSLGKQQLQTHHSFF